ncbi:recombinase family protein, partial [Clostridium tepidiprofundi]|uniref:recombinase family protein n=1 Tax=Clostridium tepidiprofundi TaxID=420412 RepID=UPI00082D214D
MRIYGYARVSTKEQNLDRQLIELKKYVDDNLIFTDKVSGKDMNRESYQLLRRIVQSGDVIYITSLDRLGRNKEQIKQELEYFKEKCVRIKVLDIPTTMVDLNAGQEWILDMVNNLLIEVLSTIAEHERKAIKRRQADGIKAAKEKGIKFGRPKVEIDDK